MKKITFYLALLGIWLYGVQVFPQSSLLLLMDDDGYTIVNQETELYVNSLTTAISDTQIANIDNFVTMLKDSLSITSLSEKFDAIYILANQTAEAGLKNLIKRSHDATAVNSPTFTAWEGYTGNGSTQYLNTNYNPNTQGVRFVQNSASLGVYSRTNQVSNSIEMGLVNSGIGETQINLSIRYTGDKLYGRINTANADYSEYNNADSRGFFALSRTGSTEFNVYKNGAGVETQASTSTAIYSGNMFILAQNNGGNPNLFSNKQIAFAFIGAGLDATEVRKVYNCIQAYMTGIGKQV